MADNKNDKASRSENMKSAAKGAIEGYTSSQGSGQTQGGGNPQSQNMGVQRVVNDKDKVEKLGKSVKDGDFQKAVVHKADKMAKETAKHPVKTATGRNTALNSKDTENVAKGAVQYASGNYVGLGETVADEANDITDEYKNDKAEKKEKRDGTLKDLGLKNDDKDEDKKKRKVDTNKDGGPNGSKKNKDEDDDSIDGKKLKKNVKRAGKAATVGAKGYIAMQAAQFMKMLMMFLMQLGQMIASVVTAIIAAIVHAAAAVAVALGVGIFVAATGIIGVVAVGLVAIFSIFTSTSESDEAARTDGYLEDDPCAGVEDSKFEAIDADNPSEEENARLVYSFFANYYNHNVNEKVAGILGNWSVESGINFHIIEGSPSNPDELVADRIKLDEYVSGDLMPNGYGNWTVPSCSSSHSTMGGWTGTNGKSISSTGYLDGGSPEYFVPGIGIGQWTGPRGKDLLDLAESSDKFEWYDAGAQLAFMISLDSRAGWVADWNDVDTGSPETGAAQFATGWEGHSSQTERETAAANWFVTIAEWDADIEYYDSIIELAGEAAQLAGQSTNHENHEQECTEEKFSYGNSLADKMSAYCMDNKADAQAAFQSAWVAAGSPTCMYGDPPHAGSDPYGIVCGSDLYVKVHQVVFENDGYYASCDRSVGTAVRWAGCDDDYSAGGCTNQITHMQTDAAWEDVTSSIHSEDDLMPGDICIHSGHIVMYLGQEMVQKYHPDADDSWHFGEGSFGDRPPCVQADSYTNYDYIFRCVSPETDSQWLNAAE